MCLVSLFPFFCFLLFYFCFFPSISIDDMGATSGVLFLLDLLSLFPNRFLFCHHGQDLRDRLMCEFNQYILIFKGKDQATHNILQ